jgi:hypothetical protein
MNSYFISKKNFFFLKEYPEMKIVFENCFKIKKNAKILMVGCGNSKLSFDM